MQKFLWSVYLCSGLALFGLVMFADCPQDGGCWSCYNSLINCATNGGGCSSNCVKFSPSDCSNFVDSASSSIAQIVSTSSLISDDVDACLVFLESSVYSSLISIQESLNSSIYALQNFDPTNDVLTALNLAKRQAQILYNRVTFIDLDGNSTSTIVYSNTVTHSFVDMSGYQSVGNRVKNILNYINNAYDAYSSFESDVINAHFSLYSILDDALEEVNSALRAVLSLRNSLHDVQTYAANIKSISNDLLLEVDSISCEACGSGSGSGSGGGGGGSTTDLTGVEAKLEEIRVLLQRLYDLVYNYYTDYNNARARPVSQSEPSYSAYQSIGDNWFRRVEYLLYSVSPLVPSNHLEGADNPEQIEGQTGYESNVQELESAVEDHEQSISDKTQQPLARLQQSFTLLWNKLSVFKSSISNVDDPLYWSHLTVLTYGDPSSSGFRLQASSDNVGITFNKFQLAFRILWFLLVLSLYLYFTVSVVKFSFKIGSFVVKLLNTSFGSS